MPNVPNHKLPIALALLVGAMSLSAASPEKAPPPGGPKAPADSQVPSVAEGGYLTTNQGQRVNDDQNTLRAGPRGPALLEDFHFREKITHFDHERIPERVVHARGTGAHGYFQVYQSLAKYTKAKVLQDTGAKTPVFVRFSTVNGSRGSADTVRDARGFAVKFYTQDGVWDLVGNNIPVFFIQDAIKFPDLVHAFKPEPDDEMPQASTAHNNFWDFIAKTPESMHMIMWIMSDRAIPRSYRMMEGFGVHTFRLVNEQGKSTFVKFHWKPLLGVHSLVWDESHELTGRDPDFHRRDLWEAIADGAFPEYELGVQLLGEDEVAKVKFDILDATKIWPEDVVPVQPVGKLVLNKNPDNFFAETEQSAFHTAHIVSGIDFSDDPLLQGRNFSYLDTQINRFGTPNFTQLPINQPKSPVNNFQQDGFMRYDNRPGKANYEPNTLPGGNAKEASPEQSGYVTYPAPVQGNKVRERPKSFDDHYTQAALFYNSMSPPEQEHIANALKFELGKVTMKEVRQRMVDHLAQIDGALAANVAGYLGLTAPTGQPAARAGSAKGLSQEESPKGNVKTRHIAILAADGVDAAEVMQLQAALKAAGAKADVVAPHLGEIKGAGGKAVAVDKSFDTADSVMYDAVYLPGGKDSVNALQALLKASQFVQEAYAHKKAIGASGAGADYLKAAGVGAAPGVVVAASEAEAVQPFIAAVGQHRHWNRADR
ncbi:catalase [Methylomagnum sp.]